MAFTTQHERQIVNGHMVIGLCARIADETNSVVFSQLLIELDALLKKLLNNHQTKPSGFEGENMVT